MTRIALVVLLLSIASALPAAAQAPDSVLVNGKIVTVDARSSVQEALAIRDGKIVALGRSVGRSQARGPATRIVDLGGPHRDSGPDRLASARDPRRAQLRDRGELDRRRSLAEALARIARRRARARPGAWLIVAGGWNEQQFAEKRRPTQAELVAAAPDNPVYVQLGYGWAMLTDDGARGRSNISSDADLPPAARSSATRRAS